MKIDFEEKRALFGVGRGASIENLHLEVNSGGSVEIGRIFNSTLQALGSHQLMICETR